MFTMLFTIKLSDVSLLTLLILCFVLNRACPIPWEITVYAYVEYSKIMLNSRRRGGGMTARLWLNVPLLEDCERQDCDISHSE